MNTPEIEDNVQGSSDRMFGLVFAAIFAGIGVWPLLHASPLRVWALLVAGSFFLLGMTIPRALSRLNRAWMKFGILLNRIISPISIGVVYFLALFPMAMVMRAFGKRPLNLKFDAIAKSYWIPRDPPGPDPKTMSDQF